MVYWSRVNFSNTAYSCTMMLTRTGTTFSRYKGSHLWICVLRMIHAGDVPRCIMLRSKIVFCGSMQYTAGKPTYLCQTTCLLVVAVCEPLSAKHGLCVPHTRTTGTDAAAATEMVIRLTSEFWFLGFWTCNSCMGCNAK